MTASSDAPVPKALWTIDSHGRLQLPSQTHRVFHSQPLEVISESERHLLLGVAKDSQDLALAGTLGEIGVADLLSFFNLFRKTGVLRLHLQGGAKNLFFDHGEIVFATSTFPEEDLGEILCAQGALSRETLQRARQLAVGRADLARLLVAKGAVTGKDLWLATRQQAEAVIYHLFAFHRGSYAFFARPLVEEEIVRLSMSTQNLIMEGLRRVDERTLFLQRIGSLDSLVLSNRGERLDLGPAEQRLLAMARSGTRTVRDLLRACGLGEFEGLRAIYQLLEHGALYLEKPATVEVGGNLGEILEVFNRALVTLYGRISEKNPSFGQEVRVFLRDLPQPYSYVFREVSLRVDGGVDGVRILGNLSGLEEGDKLKLLAEALNELIFMECLAARRELAAEGAGDLIRRVQNVTARVKNLIGRKE